LHSAEVLLHHSIPSIAQVAPQPSVFLPYTGSNSSFPLLAQILVFPSTPLGSSRISRSCLASSLHHDQLHLTQLLSSSLHQRPKAIHMHHRIRINSFLVSFTNQWSSYSKFIACPYCCFEQWRSSTKEHVSNSLWLMWFYDD
jgi:hypothetical protein